MTKTNSLALSTTLVNKLQVKETLSILAFSILIPYSMHFIPASGNPIGSILLPIFIAPFIAVVFFKWSTAVITALLSPMLNYFVTGNPHFAIVGVITTELVLFVLLSMALLKVNGLKYATAPIGLVFAMFVGQILFSSVSHFAVVLTTGLPGIVLISLVNFAAIKLSGKLK
jgi:hypothetical protein